MMRLIDADMLPMALDGHIVSIWKKDLDAVPTIDPVHAAGGCYCKECKHFLGDKKILPGGGLCLFDEMTKRLDDFCSYGERKED